MWSLLIDNMETRSISLIRQTYGLLGPLLEMESENLDKALDILTSLLLIDHNGFTQVFILIISRNGWLELFSH